MKENKRKVTLTIWLAWHPAAHRKYPWVSRVTQMEGDTHTGCALRWAQDLSPQRQDFIPRITSVISKVSEAWCCSAPTAGAVGGQRGGSEQEEGRKGSQFNKDLNLPCLFSQLWNRHGHVWCCHLFLCYWEDLCDESHPGRLLCMFYPSFRTRSKSWEATMGSCNGIMSGVSQPTLPQLHFGFSDGNCK